MASQLLNILKSLALTAEIILPKSCYSTVCLLCASSDDSSSLVPIAVKHVGLLPNILTILF